MAMGTEVRREMGMAMGIEVRREMWTALGIEVRWWCRWRWRWGEVAMGRKMEVGMEMR
jgi:hypothetical protein